jgi:hypothetical protein
VENALLKPPLRNQPLNRSQKAVERRLLKKRPSMSRSRLPSDAVVQRRLPRMV